MKFKLLIILIALGIGLLGGTPRLRSDTLWFIGLIACLSILALVLIKIKALPRLILTNMVFIYCMYSLSSSYLDSLEARPIQSLILVVITLIFFISLMTRSWKDYKCETATEPEDSADTTR